MGLPQINIDFKGLAANAIERGTRGIVAIILKDKIPAPLKNPIKVSGIKEIPDGLTEDNKKQIERAFIGYIKPPSKVVIYIQDETELNYNNAQTTLECCKWDYVCVPDISSEDTTSFATWIKECREKKGLKVKAVLPKTKADNMGIINFTTDEIKVEGVEKPFTAAQYCTRIAGILAGTPLTMSCTYAVLPEVEDVPHHTKEEFDEMVDNGELVLMNDGEKVKIARGVNSLTNVVDKLTDDMKKIKIVDAMDLIYTDIKKVIADSYIGKISNKYDNKCLLISAINTYLDELVAEGVLNNSPDSNRVGINLEATIRYLKKKNVQTDKLTTLALKQANTGSNVFLLGNLSILDAMEDVDLDFLM